MVSVFNSEEHTNQIVSAINNMNTNLGTKIDQTNADLANVYSLLNMKLTDIYNRLEHVKVDSYVNVRIMDSEGALPLEADVLSGLLVKAAFSFPPGDSLPVSIVGQPIETKLVDVTATSSLPVNLVEAFDSLEYAPVLVTNTVTVDGAVDARNQVFNVNHSAWDRQLGLGITGSQIYTLDTNNAYSTTGSVPFNGIGGNFGGVNNYEFLLSNATMGLGGINKGVYTYPP